MRFDVITIFPNFFSGFLSEGIVKRAIEAGICEVRPIDLREFTTDRHRTTDDRPFGGGAGMVMKPEPLFRALDALEQEGPALTIVLSPRGRVFDQRLAHKLSREERIILVCGRYEGIDQRVCERAHMELSIGDYVLSGGEPAAMVVMDAVIRLLPGALGCDHSVEEESFSQGLLEHPHYTRPRVYRGMEVPEVLLSGDHAAIARWRRRKSLEITLRRRPELLKKVPLSEEELEYLASLGYGPQEG